MPLDRRAFLRGCSGLAFGAAGLLNAAEGFDQPRQVRRPNIVFVFADDLGWGDLGCYGNSTIKTPNLDRLARQGTLFTSFYVPGSVCSPTRAGIMTGLFPARLSIHGHLATAEQNRARAMPNQLDPSLPTLPRFLSQAGYVTGHYGKWHLGGDPAAYGFVKNRSVDRAAAAPQGKSDWNLWDPKLRARSSEMIIDETIGFVVRHRDEPFYVQAWLLDTHATLNPSQEQMKPYERMSNPAIPHKNAYTIYAAAATDADKQIGRLMQKLDELGLAENTILIFSSDNGPEDAAIGNAGHSGVGSPGPFRGRKRSLYEGGVRVPFIVRWPGHTPAGKVDNQSVLSGVDLLPTLCLFAGVKLPADLQGDGVNAAAAVEGRSFVRTKPLMWEWRFHIAGHTLNRSPMLAIRDGKWKLLMNSDRSRVELYEIPNDPSEMTNLSEKHPDMVERLAGPLLAWQRSLPKGPVDPGAGSNKYPWPIEQPRVRP